MDLSPEQQQERHKRKIEAFNKEYKELCLKHGVQHQGFLHSTPQALLAVSLPVLIKTENEKENKPRGTS